MSTKVSHSCDRDKDDLMKNFQPISSTLTTRMKKNVFQKKGDERLSVPTNFRKAEDLMKKDSKGHRAQ